MIPYCCSNAQLTSNTIKVYTQMCDKKWHYAANGKKALKVTPLCSHARTASRCVDKVAYKNKQTNKQTNNNQRKGPRTRAAGPKGPEAARPGRGINMHQRLNCFTDSKVPTSAFSLRKMSPPCLLSFCWTCSQKKAMPQGSAAEAEQSRHPKRTRSGKYTEH